MVTYSIKQVCYHENRPAGRRIEIKYFTGWYKNTPIWSDFLTEAKQYKNIDTAQKYCKKINDMTEFAKGYAMIDREVR